jgi:hypothetical protein
MSTISYAATSVPWSGSVIFKSPWEWNVCYIYLYSIYILKSIQKDKLAAEYTKTCIFVLLVDEYYNLVNLNKQIRIGLKLGELQT